MPRPDHWGAPLWPEKTTDRLRVLWAEGKSAGECALLLADEGLGRFTRNAVLGKVHRLGLTTEGRRAPKPIPGRLAPLRPARIAPPKAVKLAPRREKAKPASGDPVSARHKDKTRLSREELEAAEAAARALEPLRGGDGAVLARSIVTLQSGQCKWPIGDPAAADFAFCARPVAITDAMSGRACYCADHKRLAYQPGKPKSQVAIEKLQRWLDSGASRRRDAA